MFSFQPFSKPRLISIGLLLAILVISLMFSSYAEGMTADANGNTEATTAVNKEAPKAPDSASESASVKASNDSNSVVLGNLSVSDVTNMLKNNAGVQKLIDQKLIDQKPTTQPPQ
jgi:hypothetical protein